MDPTTYAPFVGGITPALEIVLDEAGAVSELPGAAQVGIMVAASRMRHPLEARTLARLAARYAGEGPGTVVAFGLSIDYEVFLLSRVKEMCDATHGDSFVSVSTGIQRSVHVFNSSHG